LRILTGDQAAVGLDPARERDQVLLVERALLLQRVFQQKR